MKKDAGDDGFRDDADEILDDISIFDEELDVLSHTVVNDVMRHENASVQSSRTSSADKSDLDNLLHEYESAAKLVNTPTVEDNSEQGDLDFLPDVKVNETCALPDKYEIPEELEARKAEMKNMMRPILQNMDLDK